MDNFSSKIHVPQVASPHTAASSSSTQVPASASSSAPSPAPASLSPGSLAPVPLASSTPSTDSGSNQPLMYKNNLQEFAQRSNIALPIYQTVNEGFQHAPRFRATVWVDEKSYTSQTTFSQRKAAEQDAARLALECLSKQVKDEAWPLVSENATFCKSILNEYAAKMNLVRATYNTIQQDGLVPVFVSLVLFNGTRYIGDAAGNKKEAEQLAARAAILSILSNSGSGLVLFQTIKSKAKFYDAAKGKGLQCTCANSLSSMANSGQNSVILDDKDKVVADPVAANHSETKVELPESSRMHSSCQDFQMPNQGSSIEASQLPNASLPPGSKQPIHDGSSSKKRRKNKKKANKKARLESSLAIATFPMNPVPSCSVAQ